MKGPRTEGPIDKGNTSLIFIGVKVFDATQVKIRD